MKKIFLSLLILLSINGFCDSATFTGTTITGVNIALGLKLMPLGDSITVGTSDIPILFGYRDHLQGHLGIGVYDFVGPYTDPNSNSTYDVDHAGIAGNSADEIIPRLPALLTTYFVLPNNSRNIILLHVGTNDMNILANEQAAVDLVNQIIDMIDAHDPNIQVFVAKIIPHTEDGKDGRITVYNALLQTMVLAKQSTKPNLHLVDMNAAFKANASWETALGWSGSHPNNAGYAVMATIWAACIANTSAHYCDGN